MRDEAVEVIDKSKETSKLFSVCWCGEVSDSLNLVKARLSSILTDD